MRVPERDLSDLIVKQSSLRGRVVVSGAKNSALRLLVASLLTDQPIRLSNMPRSLLDVRVQIEMLRVLGKSVESDGHQSLLICSDAETPEMTWTDRSIRNTLLMLGALLARHGRARVPLPGGCSIGNRKYDLHLELLEKMGAQIAEEDGWLTGTVGGRLHGTDYAPPLRSTGVTENALLAGSLAVGTTRLWNPHLTPEVRQLVYFLRAMGARIRLYGHERIEVQGVDVLHGAEAEVIPDRLEAMTWLIAAACTGGQIEIDQFPISELVVPLAHLSEAGVRWLAGPDSVSVQESFCSPVEVMTGSHPAIHSDMQPLFAVYGAMARGTTRIVDLRYPNRFRYAAQLRRMGADVRPEAGGLKVVGRGALNGTTVEADDLRAGAALLLAGLAAEGTTRIRNAWQIQRGYDDLVSKLLGLGAELALEESA